MGEIIRRSSDLRRTFDAYLVNTSSLFVTQPRQLSDPAILQRGIRTEGVRRCLAGSSGSLLDADYRGVAVMSVYRWLSTRNLCLVVEIDQREALEPVQNFAATLALIAGLALAGASLVAVGLASTITRPVLALKEGVSRFGSGELQVRFPETSTDELGALSHEFNMMANSITEKETQLQNYAKTLEDRVKERTHQLTFLSDASRMLSESFDYADRLKQVASLAVPQIADWCSVDILNKDGRLERIAVVHSDPRKIELAFELERNYPSDPDSKVGLYNVVRTRKPEFYSQLPLDLLLASAKDEKHAALLRELQMRSLIIVPLVAHGHALGTISLVMAESGRQYDESTLALAEDLASRAGLLIDNAKLYQETKELNTDLERRVQERTEQLRLSEEKFYKAFKDSPAAISIASLPDGHWIDVNEAVEKMTGFSREELLGRTSTDVGLVDDQTRLIILEAIRDQGAVRNVEIQMHTKSHEVIDVLLSVEQVELNGKPSLLAIQYDITERKRVEREIRRLNDDLEQRGIALEAANKELEAFSYSVSHDLRAPLRSVDGFSQALLEDYYDLMDETGRDFLNRIRKESQRMGQLIDDLIALSRFTRTEMNLSHFNLSEVVREILTELAAQEPEREVKLEIQDQVMVCADKRLLQVALQNLLGNAWKFTSKKPDACISFGVIYKDDAKEYFVRDNGAGFDMAYAHKLFGAFQRLHAMTEFTGTGIGLAIVARVIHRHGGSVRAEGVINAGAAFYFTLDDRACE
ncbi:MAG: PAS domain S-box protein [Anaerolineae bacterium]